MKTSLANAFAVVRRNTIQEFHLKRVDTNATIVPINHYFSPRNQQNRTKIL